MGKTLLLCLIGFAALLCQDIPPFKINGERIVMLSPGFIKNGMEGYATVLLIVDSKCNLKKFAICDINISDNKNENAIQYYNDSIFSFIRNDESSICRKEFYPNYIRGIYKAIEDCVKNITIIYSGDTSDLKKENRVFYKIIIK